MMHFFYSRTIDLTKGPIIRSIIAFSVPLLLSSVLQQLYSTVDLLFVSNVLGVNATAALGISTLLISCLIGLFNGLSVGANVVVAIAFGKNGSSVHRVIASSLLLGAVGGLVLSVAGFFLAPFFIEVMKTPPSSVDDALVYLRTYFVAMVAVALYNMASGVCRALGDSMTPLYSQAVGGAMNIACNWLFLCVLHYGVEGVAFATLISNVFSAAIVVYPLWVNKELGLRVFDLFKIDRFAVKRIFRIGAPVGLQAMVISLSNVVIQYQIDLLGADAIAAFSIYYKVELPIYLAILAIGQAVTTFVAQNKGAGSFDRARKGARVCQGLGLGVSLALSVLMLSFGSEIYQIFSRDGAVIEYGLKVIAVTFPFYFLYSILEVQGDVARGLGHSLVPAVIILLNICLLRSVLVFAFSWNAVSIECIAATYPITWATTAICMVVYRLYLTRRIFTRSAA